LAIHLFESTVQASEFEPVFYVVAPVYVAHSLTVALHIIWGSSLRALLAVHWSTVEQ